MGASLELNKSKATLTLSDIICLSEKRRLILSLLGKNEYSIDELTEKMNMTAHSLSPQLKTLRDEELIILKDGVYRLTNIGEILVKNMSHLFETIDILEKDQRFWFSRNLSVIPADLAEQICNIGNYKLLEYDISEYMYAVPAEFCDNFKKSKNALCLLSIYHPIYTEM